MATLLSGQGQGKSLASIHGRVRKQHPAPAPLERNSLPGPEHHNPAPLREEACHRPPEEGALQTLPDILHLPGPGPVPLPPMPPLIPISESLRGIGLCISAS